MDKYLLSKAKKGEISYLETRLDWGRKHKEFLIYSHTTKKLSRITEQKAREGERERIIDIINNITSMYVSLPSEEIKEMLYKDNIINQINNSK